MITGGDVCEIALGDLLSNSEDGLFMIDRNRNFVLFSESLERITGYPRTAVLGNHSAGREGPGGREGQGKALVGALCPSTPIFKGDRPAVRQRLCVRHREGHHIWIETTYSAIYDSDSNVTCIVGIVREITEAKKMENELHGASGGNTGGSVGICSPLTGADVGEMGGGDSQDGDGIGSLDRILTGIEKREILNALSRANGQRTLAARLLGISRSRLYRRMEALEIDPRKVGPSEVV